MENNDSLSESSMNTLILWNINKAVERNPGINLRAALKTAQERLEVNAHDVKAIISQYPEERHLACAILAWQQLGHNSAESLCRFVLEKQGAPSGSTLVNKDMDLLDKMDIPLSSIDYVTPERSKCYDTNSIGPVIKLPVDTKIVMRLDAPSSCNRSKRSRTPEKNVMDKISKACCLDKNCATRLEALDNETLELRARAVKLAKHEQERMRLLERAEAAWKDLELSYQRRLTLAEEKEEELALQTKRLIEERNSYKAACVALANKLKGLAEDADKERANLTELEKQVCAKACIRLGLMEDAIREDSILADNQCKAAQLDRDLQFKEEQARRKLQSLQSEMDSTRTLTFEAERAMRAELTALREQITEVSKQLLTEDADNSVILKELEELRQEKMDIVDDLNGCKAMCDDKMQAIINEAKAKRAELEELQNRIMDCKCKIPIDESVEVKRTPSLAAICQCAPEDRMIEPCSCTSLRSSLLSTMLCDLFGGLQSELGDTGAAMPCQLLKCLEDKHKWDRASAVTTNLRNYFSKLLMGELDIAITNSIEKYHAKWVGASCADDMKELIDPSKTEGWQKRAIEREAQKLAAELADKMFEEKAKQLAERAKAIASENEAPPCECAPPKPDQALYSVMVEPPTMSQVAGASTSHSTWKNTANDVTMLRVEIENLKKEAIKREDLKIMEQEIAKIIQLTSSSDCDLYIENKEVKNKKEGPNNKNRPAKCPLKSNNTNNICNKVTVPKKKQVEVNNRSKNDKNSTGLQGTKQFKRPGQSYAVNICLCGSKTPKKLTSKEKTVKKSLLEEDEKLSLKQQPCNDLASQVSSIRQTKPIASVPLEDSYSVTKNSLEDSCKSNCVCFHKIPSNSSIDNLLKTLEKWQSEMATTNESAKNISTKKYQSDNDTSVTEVDNIIQQIIREDTTPLYNMRDELKPESDFNKSNPKEIDIMAIPPEKDILEGKPLDIEKLTKDGEPLYPTVTESEYMGAINLDKSNENFCKCTVDCEKEEIFPLKCMRSCSCPLKILESKTEEIMNNSSERENYQFPLAKHQPIQVKHTGLGSNNIIKSSLSKSTFMNNNVPLNMFTDMNNLVNRGVQMAYSLNSVEKDEVRNLPILSNNITKTAFPDYDIEFLGVTLTDTVNKYNNENVNKKGKLSKVEYCSRAKPEKDYKDYVENYADADQLKNIGKDNPEFFDSPNCKCQSDLKDIKNLFSTILTAQKGTTYDKCLDTQSLKDFCKKESCVCCSKNEKEKDFDLELNTFILLEEHLKRKLYELKLNCTALCYPADQEEKVLSNLIKKIRELVITSTNEVMCKCSETKEIDGSWNRALNLLQEYLNTKINRVQCLCSSPRNSNKLLVPDVMDKVCNLIDNDFSRLKQICKCKNVSRASSRKKSTEQVTFQLPEKETSFIKNEIIVNDYLLDTTNSDEDNSDTHFRLDQNVSSQVSPYIGMNNKSCITLQNEIMFAEPLLTDEINTNKDSEEIKSNSGECRSTYGKISEAFTRNFCVAKKILVNQCSDILKVDNNDENVSKLSIDPRKEEILKNVTDIPLATDESPPKNDVVDQISPYIGYTVDCTCGSNNLSDCVCSRSIVKKNNSTIDKIWKSVISKPIKQNTSYIMKSLKICDESNVVKLKEDSKISMNNESVRFCDLNTSAHVDSEIVLINSADHQNLSVIDDSTNTAGDVHSSLVNTCLNNSSAVYELAAQTTNSTVNIDEKALKSELFLHNHDRLLIGSLSQHCKCTKVPICHVKMLMDNIEDKLLKSGCTCDSLNINVCPVHSFKKN